MKSNYTYIKNISIFIILIYSIKLKAQENKSCLFVGIYEKNKKGICSEYDIVHYAISDYADYIIKRKQFDEQHKNEKPNTKFVTIKESFIAYQYQKNISGWNCISNVISTKTGKSIEDCTTYLRNQVEKYPSDFLTQPKIIFAWEGNYGSGNKYSKDFGGLNGVFSSGNIANKSIIVAKLTNNTKDKLACVSIITDNGSESVEYITPGALLTKKYDAVSLDLKVIYIDNKAPKPSIDFINTIKEFIRTSIINQEGEIKLNLEKMVAWGIRG